MSDQIFYWMGFSLSVIGGLAILCAMLYFVNVASVVVIKMLYKNLTSAYNHNQLLWIMKNILDKGAKETKKQAKNKGWRTLDKEQDK